MIESSNVCAESGEKSSETDGSTYVETLLDSKEMLRVDFEDEEVKNIKAWYKVYKANKKKAKNDNKKG